ncbi:MAG: class II aldolase/adducin family protein [Burkholderiaceae bacterium]
MNAPSIDIKASVSEQEWALRVDLAAAYRLIAMHGWDDLIFTHLSARVPGPEHHFLINPYGLAFEEITASSLVKVDQECKPVIDTVYPVNYAGFVIHSAIHAGREDVVAVMHTHTPAGVAVSAQRDGLLPISQQASVVIPNLGYHSYEGIAVYDEEKPRLQRDLGKNQGLILRNHGLLSVGASVAEAFLFLYTLQRSCEIQVMAQAGGATLIPIGQSILDGVKENIKRVSTGSPGGLAWPALLRRVDRQSPGYAD